MMQGPGFLLAIVMLLGVAQAVVTPVDNPGPCSKFIMDIPYAQHGRYSNGIQEIKFQFKPKGDDVLHTIQNACKALGTKIAKQIVELCNEDFHETKPKLAALGTEVVSPVYATCEDVPDCGPIVFHITQICDQPMLAKS